MSRFAALARLSVRDNTRSVGLLVVYLSVVVVSTVAIVALSGHFLLESAARDGASAADLGYRVWMINYMIMAGAIGSSYSSLFSVPLMRDKAQGTLECLLATPIRLREVLFAKAVGLTVPGTVAGLVAAVVSPIVLQQVFVPDARVDVNGWLVVCTFVALPLVFLALATLMHVVGLAGKVSDANVLAIIFLPGFSTVMLRLSLGGTVDAHSWPFLALNLAWAAVLGAAAWIWRGRLTRERLVQSCRS